MLEKTHHDKGCPDPNSVPEQIQDLADYPTPLGSFGLDKLIGLDWKALFEKHKLSQDQLEFYKKNGYLSNIEIFSNSECDELLKNVDEVIADEYPGRELFSEFHKNETGDPNNALCHALGHWRCTKLFHDLVFLPSITIKVSQLINESSDFSPESVRFWHDQLFVKPPKSGGNVAWHQDYSYWTRTRPIQHMTVHIALEDQTVPGIGGLEFVPGSHRWTRELDPEQKNGPLPITTRDFSDMESIKEILSEEEIQNWKPVSGQLKKGQVSFHHPLTVHGSFPNKSENWRRATVLNYFADGTQSHSDENIQHGCTPKGQAMGGKFHPIVFDKKWLE